MFRFFIRSEFTDRLRVTCNMKSRICRGGARDLYRLLMKSDAMSQYIDKDSIQIVSGLGHTFIRVRDDEYNRFLYIDPTIAQFNSSFEGIFVGDEQDLFNIQTKQKGVSGYKLNMGNYLGPDYKEKKFGLPPLQIEKILMKTAVAGSRRRTIKKPKRIGIYYK